MERNRESKRYFELYPYLAFDTFRLPRYGVPFFLARTPVFVAPACNLLATISRKPFCNASTQHLFFLNRQTFAGKREKSRRKSAENVLNNIVWGSSWTSVCEGEGWGYIFWSIDSTLIYNELALSYLEWFHYSISISTDSIIQQHWYNLDKLTFFWYWFTIPTDTILT